MQQFILSWGAAFGRHFCDVNCLKVGRRARGQSRLRHLMRRRKITRLLRCWSTRCCYDWYHVLYPRGRRLYRDHLYLSRGKIVGNKRNPFRHPIRQRRKNSLRAGSVTRSYSLASSRTSARRLGNMLKGGGGTHVAESRATCWSLKWLAGHDPYTYDKTKQWTHRSVKKVFI